MNDLRTPIAKARDKWLASKDGLRAQEGIAQWIYLRNQLEAGFVAGWNAHEKEATHDKTQGS